MPLFGTLETASVLAGAPSVTALFGAADECELAQADVLTLTYEIDIDRGQRALPKALHPSLPMYAQVIVRRYDDGPWGACASAELRINARAGTNYLGYCVGVLVQGDAYLAALRERYGARATAGEVRLERRYYGVVVSARADGACWLDCEVSQLLPISGKDVLFTPNVNLALVDGAPRLVHQEMEYTMRSAERGACALRGLDAAAFGDDRVLFRNALPATFVKADVKYTAVRYLLDPDVPALKGTVSVE